MKYSAEMPSYTYAVKAERLLRSSGFRCELIRRRSACGYDLVIYDSSAADFLRRSRIPFELRPLTQRGDGS